MAAPPQSAVSAATAVSAAPASLVLLAAVRAVPERPAAMVVTAERPAPAAWVVPVVPLADSALQPELMRLAVGAATVARRVSVAPAAPVLPGPRVPPRLWRALPVVRAVSAVMAVRAVLAPPVVPAAARP